MSIDSGEGLSKADFDAVEWPALLTSITPQVCSEYGRPLNVRANELEKLKLMTAARAARILADIVCYGFHPEDSSEYVFRPIMVWEGRRSAMPEDLSVEIVPVLRKVVEEASLPEFRARVGDVCLGRTLGKDKASFETVITAYLDSADHLFGHGMHRQGVLRVKRALQLTKRATPQLIERIKDTFAGFLRKSIDETPLWDVVAMLGIMQNSGIAVKSPLAFARIAGKYASKAVKQKQWEIQCALLTNQARWYVQANKEGDALRVFSLAAETHVRVAERALKPPFSSPISASISLGRAISAHRKLNPKSKRIGVLERMRSELQKRGVKEAQKRSYAGLVQDKALMKLLLKKQDFFQDFGRKAAAAVQGKSFYDAVRMLALVHRPPNKVAIQEMVQHELKTSVWTAVLPMTLYDEEGSPFANAGSFLHADPEGKALVAESRCLHHFKTDHVPQVVTLIEAVREQILLDHSVFPELVAPIIQHSPFVPQSREVFFARGLLAGFNGDFLLSAHILAPQFEEAIRAQLSAKGIVTTVDERSGTQKQADLNSLFNRKRADIEAVFGGDVAFELEALLVRRWGCNLRNDIAHGRLTPYEFAAAPVCYMWWLALRLCIFGVAPLPGLGKQANDGH